MHCVVFASRYAQRDCQVDVEAAAVYRLLKRATGHAFRRRQRDTEFKKHRG